MGNNLAVKVRYGISIGGTTMVSVMRWNSKKVYINEGFRWIVYIDLEKFFDKVNHDILMYKISKDISDKTLT